MNKKCKDELLLAISQSSFMLDDIALYLNTHPNCQHGLKAFKKYKKLREELLADYEEEYGPLLRYDVDSDYDWGWIDSPWPWEGVCK